MTWLVAACAAVGQVPTPDVVVATAAPEAGEPVGRVTALQGNVGVTPPGVAAPMPADNRPLAGGERVETAADARALLRLGSTALRLGPRVDLVVRRLDDAQVLIELDAGSVGLQVATQDWADRIVVVTAEGQWRAARPGHYRLDRWPDATRATVWEGELRFDAADSTLAIPVGRRAELWLQDGQGPVQLAWGEPVPDEFAQWVQRDAREAAQAAALRHVSPEVTGWEDLDAHGDWQSDPQWGSVWVPRGVEAGWSPYGDGQWTWIAPWGWTWVDASAWGFAPFHYGRWVQRQGRWAWVPGPRHLRPRFTPAPPGWTPPPALRAPSPRPVPVPPPVHLPERPKPAPRLGSMPPRPPDGVGPPGGRVAPSPPASHQDPPSRERKVRPDPALGATPRTTPAPAPGPVHAPPRGTPSPPGAAPAPPGITPPPLTVPPRRDVAPLPVELPRPPAPPEPPRESPGGKLPDAASGRPRAPAATP